MAFMVISGKPKFLLKSVPAKRLALMMHEEFKEILTTLMHELN